MPYTQPLNVVPLQAVVGGQAGSDSVRTLQTYINSTTPYFATVQNGGITISTITASTITATSELQVAQSNAGWVVINNGTNITEGKLVEYVSPGANFAVDTMRAVVASTGDDKLELKRSLNLVPNSAIDEFKVDEIVRGAILYGSSIFGGQGGVSIISENNTSAVVRDEGLTIVSSNAGLSELNMFMADGLNKYIQHYPSPIVPGQPSEQIHFNSATSSISLVNSAGQSMGVGDFGIGLNPGTGLPVTLVSGYMNLSNSAMSNVSSINGYTPYKIAVVQEPDQPLTPVNTNGGQTQIFDFPSTITGDSYRVTLAGNLGLATGGFQVGDVINIYFIGGGEGIVALASYPASIIPANPSGLNVSLSGIYNDTNGSGFGVFFDSISAAGGQGATSANWTYNSCYIENLGTRQPLPSTIW